VIDVGAVEGQIIRFELDTSSGSWLVPREVQVFGKNKRLPATASAATGDASRIVDGDLDTEWDNGSAGVNTEFELDLGASFSIERIDYLDDYNRNLRVTVDGVEVWNGWTTGAADWAEIIPSTTVTGRYVRFQLNAGPWLVPREVVVLGG